MEAIKEIKTTYITKYKAADGKTFNTEQECADYEKQYLEQEAIYKAIECKNIYDPFALWDSEPDVSQLYILKNKADYEALKAHYMDGVDYWEEPKNYPTVIAVFSKDCYSMGYVIDKDRAKYFEELLEDIYAYLYKIRESQTSHF